MSEFVNVKVSNIVSPSSNREVPNQFRIDVGDKTFFQSYRTIIAMVKDRKLTLDIKALDYSRTTSKWLYEFMRDMGFGYIADRKSVLKGIKEGEIATADLN